jgi:fatty acid desaturase
VASAFSELLTIVRREGLLKPRPVYYRVLISSNLIAFAVGWISFVVIGNSWFQVLTALFLAATFAQTAFIVHDAGHRHVSRSRRTNDFIGMLHSTILIGFAYGWWLQKHHRHHVHPNHIGKDPDIVNKFIIFAPSEIRGRWWIRRFLLENQGYLFVPFSMFQALSMHVHSVKALIGPNYQKRFPEIMLMITHIVLYFGIVAAVLSPLKAVVFIVVHQAMLGLYLVSAFAPNHKGMYILSENEELDFLRRQVFTSRNVKGGLVLSFMLGGLNYQIEHHLFPAMARPNLRRAQPIVRAFCVANGLPYVETRLLDSFGQVLNYLHRLGRGLGEAAEGL